MSFEDNRMLSDDQVEVENIRLACSHHFVALSRNFRKRVKQDDYGNLILDDRPAEAEKFLINKGLNFRSIGEIRAIKLVISEVAKMDEQKANTPFGSSQAPVDGLDFEQWVAESLQKFGWQARATQGSSDQGVDVVAT